MKNVQSNEATQAAAQPDQFNPRLLSGRRTGHGFILIDVTALWLPLSHDYLYGAIQDQVRSQSRWDYAEEAL